MKDPAEHCRISRSGVRSWVVLMLTYERFVKTAPVALDDSRSFQPLEWLLIILQGSTGTAIVVLLPDGLRNRLRLIAMLQIWNRTFTENLLIARCQNLFRSRDIRLVRCLNSISKGRCLSSNPHDTSKSSMSYPENSCACTDFSSQVYPETFLIYHAGVGRIVFIGLLKLTTIFLFSYACFIVAPTYYLAPEEPNWIVPIGPYKLR